MSGLIRGLTLTHPWAWCIAHGGKDVENRRWRPERMGGQVGMHLAIHGGAVPGKNTGKREEARLDLAAALRLLNGPGTTDPQVLALERGLAAPGEEEYFTPGIVAVARLAGVTQHSQSPWAAQDQYHWLLADVVTLPEAVPHRGAQGLWTLEDGALRRVRELYRATRRT